MGEIELSPIEIAALVSGVLYVVFISKNIIWAWPAGILGSVLSMWLVWEAALFNEVLLYIVYIILGIYGWITWNKHSDQELPIRRWLPKERNLLILIGVLYTFFSGFLVNKYLSSDVPYLDAFTTGFSFVGTYMQAQKLIENWWIWIIVNGLSAGLYFYKGLHILSIQFIIFLILAIYGFIQWQIILNSSHENIA